MQSASMRASCSQLASSSTAAHRRQACMPSTSGRVAAQTPAAAAAAPRQAGRSLLRRQAVKNEEAELDRIAQQAGQADIWDSEIVGNAVKVLLVAGIVAVAVFIGRLGEPMVENTIKSFPTPAEYEAYEESR